MIWNNISLIQDEQALACNGFLLLPVNNLKQVMKPILVLLTGLFLIVLSCNKEQQKKETGITSAWKETDYYYSIGGPAIWKPTEDTTAEIIRFINDGIFYSSEHTLWNRYIIESPEPTSGIAPLKLYRSGTLDTTTWFLKTVTPETIEIAFGGCIEGCGKRFSRVLD